MYCKIGYLLGVKPNSKNQTIVIELGDQLLDISIFEYFCWMTIGTEKFSEIDTPPEIINSLLQKGLIIEIAWNEISIQKLFKHKLIRQGLGILNDDENGAYCVFATNEGVNTLSDFQMQLWQKANGRKTIEEIFNEVSQNQSIDEVNYCGQIVFLVEHCLAFIY